MKLYISLLTVLLLSLNLRAQKKIYNIDGNKNVKGTFSLLQVDASDVNQEAVIASGTLLAAAGQAIFKTGLGIWRSNLEKKAELAISSVVTNPLSLNIESATNMELVSYYFEKKNHAKATSFQTVKIKAGLKKDSILSLTVQSLNSDFTRALIKNNRNMIIYDLVLSGNIDYKKGGEVKTKTFSTNFLIHQPEANSAIQPKQTNQLVLPEKVVAITLTCTLKEVNPYFQTSSSMAKFLENYGDSVAEVLSGLLIESSDD